MNSYQIPINGAAGSYYAEGMAVNKGSRYHCLAIYGSYDSD